MYRARSIPLTFYEYHSKKGVSLINGPGMLKGVESGITDIGLAHIQYNPGRMSVTEACDLPHGFPSG